MIGKGYKTEREPATMKRFVVEENGVLYLVTNYRRVKGVIQMSNGKFWKFPLNRRKGTN